MKTTLRVCWSALLAAGAGLTAAEPARDPNLGQLRQIAESGRYEHALRAADRNLQQYPDDPRLLEFRAQVAEALARAAGSPRIVPATAESPAPIANRRPEPGRDFTAETSESAMIWIAPGSFTMCNPRGSDDDTFVTISRGFWLGRTEVTQEQWRAVMDHLPDPSYFKGSERPAERISWIGAMEFCRKVTERERTAGRLPPDYEYTLPTEAQWEYACRAGTTGHHAGDIDRMAWYELNADRQTHPVAQKEPNAWGLYDMHGNVWEWCADGYAGYPGGSVTDPMNDYSGPSAGDMRILRGGTWGSPVGLCRSAGRAWQILSFSTSGNGFRLALAPVRSAAGVAVPPGR